MLLVLFSGFRCTSHTVGNRFNRLDHQCSCHSNDFLAAEEIRLESYKLARCLAGERGPDGYHLRWADDLEAH